MASSTTQLQNFLTEYFQGRETQIYGRAATGLYTLFESIRIQHGPGEVVIPAICCESVAIAAFFAGLKPVIADIDSESLCLSPLALQQVLNERTRAVVLVYIFGRPVDPQPFIKMQQHFDFLLIEDLAQAVGGEWNGRQLGQTADYTLFSFADQKIIDGSAGALVRRTERGPELKRFEPENLIKGSSQSLARISLRNFCHGLFDLARSDWNIDVSPLFWRQVENYRSVYLLPDELIETDGVIDQFRNLPKQRVLRHQNYSRYRNEIESEFLTPAYFPEGAMIWRVPLMASDQETAFLLTRLLREQGILVSNHYFPLDKLMYGRSSETAEKAGRCLLNLWVDDSVSKKHIDSAVSIINGFFK